RRASRRSTIARGGDRPRRLFARPTRPYGSPGSVRLRARADRPRVCRRCSDRRSAERERLRAAAGGRGLSALCEAVVAPTGRRRMEYQTEPVTMWFDRRIVMRSSPIHGIGVFATHPIRAGERLIWVSGGIVYTTEDWRTGKVQLEPEQYNEAQIGED